MIKVLVKSAWGSNDPTQAAFPFLHANALGEATSLMRSVVLEAIHPMGWPPLSETFQKTLAGGIRIHV